MMDVEAFHDIEYISNNNEKYSTFEYRDHANSIMKNESSRD